MSRMAEAVCFSLAKWRVLRRQPGDAGERSASFDRRAYQAWRRSELERQFFGHFSSDDVIGKDVIDFGCGGGELSLMVAEMGARSVFGIEADPCQFGLALRNLERSDVLPKPEFIQSKDVQSINRPSGSTDVILCFDTLEHVMNYKEIISEWRRILRPGGHVLIWWIPYYHPWGHHVESLVPLPWAHAVFSDRTIISTAARIYDMPKFRPRIWDLDDRGRKKANKWLSIQTLPSVNKLTIAEFEKICRALNFTLVRREYHPISRSKLARAISAPLTKVSASREFFTGVAIYDLQKPVDPPAR